MNMRSKDWGRSDTVWFVVAMKKDLLYPEPRETGCNTPAAGPRVSYTLWTGTLTMSPHKMTGISGSYASCKAACTPT